MASRIFQPTWFLASAVISLPFSSLMSVCFNPETLISLSTSSSFAVWLWPVLSAAQCVFSLFLFLQLSSCRWAPTQQRRIIFLENVNPTNGSGGSDTGSGADRVITWQEWSRERESSICSNSVICVCPHTTVFPNTNSRPLSFCPLLCLSVWQPLNADIQAAESNRKECVSSKKRDESQSNKERRSNARRHLPLFKVRLFWQFFHVDYRNP